MRLGISGQLAKTLPSTNPCESMIEIVRYTQRNVMRWQDGDKARLITRRAYGFHSARAALALIHLTCGPITFSLPHEQIA